MAFNPKLYEALIRRGLDKEDANKVARGQHPVKGGKSKKNHPAGGAIQRRLLKGK